MNAHADMKEHEVTDNEIKQWKCPQKIESELVSSTPPLFGHGKANLWRRRRRSSGCHGGHGSTRVVASMVKIFSVGLHGFPEVDTKMARDFNCSTASSFECVRRLCSSWWSVPYNTEQAAATDPGFGMQTCHFASPASAMSLYRQFFFFVTQTFWHWGPFAHMGFRKVYTCLPAGTCLDMRSSRCRPVGPRLEWLGRLEWLEWLGFFMMICKEGRVPLPHSTGRGEF